MSSPLASAAARSEAMSRIVVIEQPNYVPWLGYFDLMRQCGVWVWYDDVQYTRRDWRNRNRVAAHGDPLWLTVPVKAKGRYEQLIRDVEIDYAQPWVRRHLETLRRCYARAPFFDRIHPLVAAALEAGHRYLADLTISLNESIAALLGFAPRFLRSSAIPRLGAGRQERLLEICRAAGAAAYLSGPAARAYIEPERFARAQIELRYIVYDYPPYPRGGRPFVPNLSIVDTLSWIGPEATAALLEAHGRFEVESC